MKIVPGRLGREYRYANIVRSGDIVEVTLHLNKHKHAIKNMGNGEYMVLETGELKPYHRDGETKAETLDLVKQSVRELMRTINANASSVRDKGLWVTRTYAENMKSLPQLCKDSKEFYRKVRKQYPGVQYITAVEPQERGAWHTHDLLWIPDGKLFIDKQQLAEMWGKGFVNVQRVKDVDNIGAYLSAYLTNIKHGDTTKKGARLHLYPKGMRIWRTSQGVARPEVECWKPPGKVRSVVGTATPCYAPPPVDIFGDDGRLLNSVKHLQYNMKRQSGQ